jgi:hypothetical protein
MSDAYARVTVIERDPVQRTTEHRRGVPQGRHAHLLVSGGVQVFDGLFKGLFEDLSAAGVPAVRDFAEIWFAPGGGQPLRLQGRSEDLIMCQASRLFLEAEIRARVRALPNVEEVDQCEAIGVTANAARDRVTGVRVRRRTDGRVEEVINADLVVDATGRGSRAPAWLAALGYDEPRQEQLTINLMYVTRHLRLRPGELDAKVVAIGAQPGRPTGLVLFRENDRRWILTVFGYIGHHPPRDAEGLVGFVEAIAPADVFAAISHAEPVDDIVAYRFPANVRWRYERLRRFPAGFLVFGDAICRTNPSYGLGMSVAALQAASLRDTLAGGDRDLARRFFRVAAKPVEMAWQAAVGSDLALPRVKGPRPLPVRIVGAYIVQAMHAAERDPVVAQQFLHVTALQNPSRSLFRPLTAFRVLRHLPRGSAPTIDASCRRRQRPDR